jgi:hypothetical protein
MNAQELKKTILEWELSNGESFVDYFAHAAIHPPSYAFWLIGKGFQEEGNAIISEYLYSDTEYVDMGIMFEIFPEYVEEAYSEENFQKNMELLSEFLCATPHYTNKVLNFFQEYA